MNTQPSAQFPENLLPYVVADCVCREAASVTDSEAPLSYADRLAERAEHCYAHSAHFAKRLRGAYGREYLYAFMRHWLSGELKREHMALFRKLPSGFANGMPA